MAKHRAVIPFIVDENPDQISAFLRDTPLSTAQTTSYRVTLGEEYDNQPYPKAKENQNETLHTVLEINRTLKKRGYEESRLRERLDRQYEYLAKGLQDIANEYPDEILNPQDISALAQGLLENLSDA